MKEYLPERIIIEVHQPIGSFYLGKFTPKELHLIANKDLSRYQDIEKGIQRDISPERIKEIKDYVKQPSATFPNSIIIAVGYDDNLEPNWEFNNMTNVIKIRKGQNVANVIDGQHRLAGLSNEDESFELPVAIFLGVPWIEQGIIFATINNNQRKVNQSLVYELYGMSKERRVQTVAYRIVSLLNEQEESPWYQKIKMLGKAKNDGDLSQGAFSKYLHEKILDSGKPLHYLYQEEKDAVVFKLLFNYFTAIKKIFPVVWENKDKEYILTKTTGFVGFMLFFGDLIKLAKDSHESMTVDYFERKIKGSSADFLLFNNDNYKSGGVGQMKIRDTLRGGLTSEEKIKLNITK